MQVDKQCEKYYLRVRSIRSERLALARSVTSLRKDFLRGNARKNENDGILNYRCGYGIQGPDSMNASCIRAFCETIKRSSEDMRVEVKRLVEEEKKVVETMRDHVARVAQNMAPIYELFGTGKQTLTQFLELYNDRIDNHIRRFGEETLECIGPVPTRNLADHWDLLA